MISEKDNKRITEARQLNPNDWGTAYAWADDADSEEAREELKFIGKIKYRAEEASVGCL